MEHCSPVDFDTKQMPITTLMIAATSLAPTKLPEGNMYDSITKLHLELFQMTRDGPMSDNGEIESDMPVRSQPMSYHYGLLSTAATVLAYGS